MGGGRGLRLGLVKFSYKKNPESDFFYKESKSNKKKFWRLGGEVVGVWLGKVIFFLFFFKRIQVFSKESKSEKKICFLFEEVKVREDWLV